MFKTTYTVEPQALYAKTEFKNKMSSIIHMLCVGVCEVKTSKWSIAANKM